MRLVVDLQCAQSGSRLGGIGRYSMDLLSGMIRNSREHEIIVVLSSLYPQQVNEVRAQLRNLLDVNNIVTFDVPHGTAFMKGNHELLAAAEVLRESFIRDLNPDAVHIASLFEGVHEDIVASIDRVPGGAPVAVTLYDLIPLKQRDLYLKNVRTRAHYYSRFRELKKASALLAISEFSANEVLAEFGNYHGIVQDIKAGIDPQFRILPDAATLAVDSDLLNKIDSEFILYTASFDVRKNHAGLVRAFSGLNPATREKYKIVFAGNGTRQDYERIYIYAESVGVRRDQVVFTGRVSDEDLILLYNMCSLFVFPSHWEGLGLPVLEALACGATVISSNTTSIPEVLGCSEGLFDPFDNRDFTLKLSRALSDAGFRRGLRAHVSAHLADFTWDRTADRAWDAIERCVAAEKSLQNNRHQAVDFVEALSASCHLDEMEPEELVRVSTAAALNEISLQAAHVPLERRIGWISSWGTRCGIASYSKKFLDYMPKVAAVLAPYAESAEAIEGYDIFRCWNQGKDDSLSILSSTIDELSLTDIFIQFNYGFFDFHALNRLVDEQTKANRRIFITLHSTVDQTTEERFQLQYLRGSLTQCSAIFVHSPHDIARLALLGLSSNVFLISDGANPALVNRLPIRPMGRRVASYGFALPGKGLEQLVEAARLLKDAGEPIELRMQNAHYGDSYGISDGVVTEIKRLIAAHNLHDNVTLDDSYTSDEESIDRLQEADLIVFPYQRTGESSSAAVRMGLTSQRPVACSPLEIFSDVRDAVHLLDGRSPAEIASGISRFFREAAAGHDAYYKRRAAAAEWLRVNDLRKITRFLDLKMRQAAVSQTWRSVIAPEMSALPLIQGTYENGCIRSGASDGVLCYGPYAMLDMGLHQLLVRGTIEKRRPDSRMKITLTADGGQRTLSQYFIDQLASDEVFECKFALPEKADGVEVIIEAIGGADVSISAYEVLKRYPC